MALAAATTTGPEYSSVDAFSFNRASTPSTATGARSNTRCTTGVAFSLTTGMALRTPSAAALPSTPAVSTVYVTARPVDLTPAPTSCVSSPTSSRQSVSSRPDRRTAARVSGTSSRIAAAKPAISSAAPFTACSTGMSANRNAATALPTTHATIPPARVIDGGRTAAPAEAIAAVGSTTG